MTASIDNFARLLFDEAKAFLETGRNASAPEVQAAHLHASLLLGFCAFEAHVNSIADDFHTRGDLTLLDQSILREKKIDLVDGEHQLTNELKMYRLEDRILYLFAKFSTMPLDRESVYWGEFKMALKLRNELTHPKTPPIVNVNARSKTLFGTMRSETGTTLRRQRCKPTAKELLSGFNFFPVTL